MTWFVEYRLVAQLKIHLVCTLRKFRYYANKHDTPYLLEFFPLSGIVFEIKTLNENFATMWSCNFFYCATHDQFTIPRHHFYDCNSFRLEIIGVATDFSVHTVCMKEGSTQFLSHWINMALAILWKTDSRILLHRFV